MIAPLSPADIDRFRVVVRDRWPACAEAQGIRAPGDGSVQPGVSDMLARAIEGLARILEDAGYAIERRGSARIVTGWVTIGGRRIADMDPWDPVREMYHTGLSLGRAARDRARQEGIAGNAKYEHAVSVNEMTRRSRV